MKKRLLRTRFLNDCMDQWTAWKPTHYQLWKISRNMISPPSRPCTSAYIQAIPTDWPVWSQDERYFSRSALYTILKNPMRIGIITGLFDRKPEYRTRTIAWLFDERVERNDD
ncbi:MAG: hypothetical protein HOB98_11560 [Gammaproteobacteria bacterium]|nr:hypothetical protein [Gammaproteobacteria bacterium]MBT4377282.1 hypothetical protein [Gammaproteobacteria bacterium]MBT4617073.1 hypothetical protein [Gammaproteobacteria bacterium]MBT6570187.1 hypothetical protein [Gammaproteobacteria bacterium]MBT6950468.1 hypothetical protein [Gammaproteobacteria bacterium]